MSKPKLRRKPAVTPKLTLAQIEQILGALPRPHPSTPPPAATPPPSVASAKEGPLMWHFQHTHPELPNSIINLCTVAPTVQEARGKAYLLAESFCQNIIGFIRANTPTQLPQL